MTTDTQREELLPCPFCGGPVRLERAGVHTDYIHGPREFWGVVCRNTTNRGGSCCMEQVPSASKEAAIARWNMRNGAADANLLAADKAGGEVYPPDGTAAPFTVINLGHGKVQMGDSIHDDRLPALWFGKEGKGIGHVEELNRCAKEGETLAVVTFSNVEGLDVLLDVIFRIRGASFQNAPSYTHQQPAQQPLTDEIKTLRAISSEYNEWIRFHAAGGSYDDFLKSIGIGKDQS